MKILIALILLFLAGCGSEEGRDNYGYGWHYDVQGASGLRVRYQKGQTEPSLADIEKLYSNTMSCTGINTTAPLIIFVESLGPHIRGTTYLDTGTMIIATAINDIASAMTAVIKHEFVHHLLHQSGSPVRENRNHQSNFFLDCVVPNRNETTN